MTDHACNGGCAKCIPELSVDYWRQRAHKAEQRIKDLIEIIELRE